MASSAFDFEVLNQEEQFRAISLRSPGEGKGYPLQYSGLENIVPGLYSPWGRKELDTINGHEFEQALEVDDGQGIMACCILWGRKESDTTE